MKLKTLKDTDIKGKTILYRSPYDIGVKELNGQLILKDTSRIKATIPTLQYLLENDCKIVIVTWVKRPETEEDKKLLTTKTHADELANRLGHPVEHIDECVGEKVQKRISELQPKEILMLENTRFHKEEFEDNDNFAKQLTEGSDLIVFDGFPQAHREHSSTTGILRHLPAVAGLYFEKEFESLNGLLDNPKPPFTVIIGGAKISDKIDAVQNLLKKADYMLVGGGVANIMMVAQGKNMGNSYVEDSLKTTDNEKNKDNSESLVNVARKIIDKAGKPKHIIETSTEMNDDEKLQLPFDFITGESMEDDSQFELAVAQDQINVVPENMGAYDIGPIATRTFVEIIKKSNTIFWAGPMGVYEKPNYSIGTKNVIEAISYQKHETTIAAGGDTIDALNKFGIPESFTHISLAGGATLDFLGGKELPVLKYLAK